MDKELRKIEINAICKINRAIALELKGKIFEQIIKETIQEAIDYAHSSAQLKLNKEKGFEEYLKTFNYYDCYQGYYTEKGYCSKETMFKKYEKIISALIV